jgi:transposase-like protein
MPKQKGARKVRFRVIVEKTLEELWGMDEVYEIYKDDPAKFQEMAIELLMEDISFLLEDANIRVERIEVEERPKRYQCESCGETFDEKTFSHGRAKDDGKGNAVEVECGPISEVTP